MSATVTTNTVFEAFIEADKAMKELPAIREELATTQFELATVKKHSDDLAYDLMCRERDLEQIKAALAAREAELASATFREQEIRAKHEALRSLLATGLTTTEVAKPAEVNPTSVEVSGWEASTSDTQASSQPTPSDPIGNQIAANEGQSAADPTDGADAPLTNTQSTSAEHQSAMKPNNAESASAANPAEAVAHMGEGQQTASGSTTNGTPGAQAASSPNTPLPFAGRLYTSKPDGMEWGYWIVNGGEPVPWMGQKTVEQLRLDYAMWIGHPNREGQAAA